MIKPPIRKSEMVEDNLKKHDKVDYSKYGCDQ